MKIDTTSGVGTLVLRASDRAPQKGRSFVSEMFLEEGLGDSFIAQTVITELITNACKHTDSETVVARVVPDDEAALTIEVWDSSDEAPVMGPDEDFESESGRGLLLMSFLVDDWGTRPLSGGGKIVWARLG
ncbi:ATP-binding protein [Spirillospora sp. CA-294931]|uniref:ATP-binding protein n=1 Tax=Spirillospora sp. CA-294931 TaxID=3240042 RepID=UPI003D926807